MADSKISNLDSITSLTDDDLLVVVNDPAGTPTTNKITVADALGGKADLSGATFTDDVSLDTRLLLADGTAASPAIGFTGDLDSGLYYSGGAVRVAFNGAQTFAFGGGIAYSEDLLPSATETSALGGTLNRWNTFYTKDGNFSGNVTLASVDINGGNIDGTAIGATTTSSGAFTTLSATGNVTLGDAVGDTITVNGTISANSQSITPTELGYIANVTSDVQAQLDSAATTGKAIAMAIVFG